MNNLDVELKPGDFVKLAWTDDWLDCDYGIVTQLSQHKHYISTIGRKQFGVRDDNCFRVVKITEEEYRAAVAMEAISP
jgi:hypothetical protein